MLLGVGCVRNSGTGKDFCIAKRFANTLYMCMQRKLDYRRRVSSLFFRTLVRRFNNHLPSSLPHLFCLFMLCHFVSVYNVFYNLNYCALVFTWCRLVCTFVTLPLILFEFVVYCVLKIWFLFFYLLFSYVYCNHVVDSLNGNLEVLKGVSFVIFISCCFCFKLSCCFQDTRTIMKRRVGCGRSQ